MPGLFGALSRGLDRLTRNGTGESVNFNSSWFSNASVTGIQVNQQTALQVTAVMSCVSIISEDVAKLTPRLVRTASNGRRTFLKPKEHPLARLLKRPNDWQTYFEWCQMVMVGLLLRGNAYSIILRDGRGNPTCLVPINPDRVSLWEAPGGELFWMITRTGLHELFVLRHVPMLVPYEDVLHWKLLSSNGLLGASKIALNREAIGLASALEQMSAYTVGNGAFAKGTLETDKKTNKDVIERLRAQWEQQKGGIMNSGKPLILEDGLKWNPFKLSFTDMEFLASRTFQVEEIARMWRISPSMLGIMMKGGTNHISEQSQEYLNTCLMTYVDLIEGRWAFTFGLDLDGDLSVELDLSKILRADIAARTTAYKGLFQVASLTPNEIRLAEGLEPSDDPNADKLWRPVQMVPIDADVALGADLPGLGSDLTGEQAPGGGRPNADGTEAAPSDAMPASKKKQRYSEDQPRDDNGRFASGGLKDNEKKAILDYTGVQSQAINRELRGIRPESGKYGETIGGLDSALADAKTEGEQTVYRGLTSAGVNALNGQVSKGSVITDKGFVSTSSSKEVASEFANQSSSNIMMEIHVPSGSHAMNISSVSDAPAEKEVLIARNSSFTVISYSQSNRTLKVRLN